MTSELQELVIMHTEEWERDTNWVRPNLADALDFMVTEVAEAVDKRLRLEAYSRNTKKASPSNAAIAEEIFDAVMMGCIALDLLGEDLEVAAIKKLTKMDVRLREESAKL